ncbi:C-terminal binding protein [Halostella litorea]|uniref:C-terminal binding protein n=1 Tax=Halostella litorea TaxID=2528831 RepID=UPI0010920923|nr:C-terminal binding protein [Halostella litorea]
MEVVVSDTPFVDAELFRDRLDADVTVADTSTEAAVSAAAATADALVVDVNTPATAAVFEACESLRLVARAGTGVDNVDVAAAAEHGVTVTNVPDYSTDEVATHALSLLLACKRRLRPYDAEVRDGEWAWEAGRPLSPVVGSTLGVVSFGAIARRLVELADGFDLDVAVYDPYVDEATVAEYGARRVDFGTLLDESDAVSVHAPLTDETRGMFDADAFERLDDGAVLVNVGRGGIVDEDALYDALTGGDLAAAGLDVLAEEPPDGSPLFDLENVVVTPHAGFYSERSLADLNETLLADVQAVLAGEDPEHVVDPDADWR